MSLTSKITLGSACLLSVGTISYVHYKQNSDREKLHEGVIRDIERQQKKKAENLYFLQKQIDLTKQLRKEAENLEPLEKKNN